MQILQVLSGPLVGGVIGYFTNFLAVKMLFHPLYPVKIGKFTLPFTPGIIPKRKESLAKAIGVAVGENLLTKEDIVEIFEDEKVKSSIIEGILEKGKKAMDTTVEGLALKVMTPQKLEEKKAELTRVITEKIKTELVDMDLGQLIAKGGSEVLKEKFQGGMLSMFINDEFIASLAEPIGKEVEKYIEGHGEEIFEPVVDKQLGVVLEKQTSEIAGLLGMDSSNLLKGMDEAYDRLVGENIEKLLVHFDVSAIVQEKVQAMDVEELERLVLSVMKKELDVIVNLGALIGFVIGIVNIFI